jgi:hypothetical protein
MPRFTSRNIIRLSQDCPKGSNVLRPGLMTLLPWPMEDMGGGMRNRAASSKEGKQMKTSGDSVQNEKIRRTFFIMPPDLNL